MTDELESVDVELVLALLPLVPRTHLGTRPLERPDPFRRVRVIRIIDLPVGDRAFALLLPEDM